MNSRSALLISDWWHADGAEKRDTDLGFEIHEVRYARRLRSA